MEALFSRVLNMSMTGSVAILLVMAARLLLKRFPKIYAYVLWAVVLFRLLCPVSLSASVSALGWLQPEVTASTTVTSTVSYLPGGYVPSPGEPVAAPQAAPEQPREQPADTKPHIAGIACRIWLLGASVMALYSLAQYLLLHRRVAGAVLYRGDVYLADYIDTPFVMGVLRPRVYLPSGTPKAERRFIIAHERHHIRRGDPLWKLLGYIALCFHWFNPLVWAAFLLAGKDMEMSCDEAVIQRLGAEIRADYSASLLRLATGRKIIAGMPLAFGEGDTRGRVLNMARWRKPKVWVSALCAVLCLAVLAACALNPNAKNPPAELPFVLENLPEGYTCEADGEQGYAFKAGSKSIGGIVRYDVPQSARDTYDPYFEWLADVGIPDYETLARSGGSSLYGDWDIRLESDVPPGTEATVDRYHTFFVVEDSVYDVWFDMMQINDNTRDTILKALTADDSAENPTIPVVNMPYEILEMPAGGYSYQAEPDGTVTFRKGDTVVGGIAAYPIPAGVYDANDDVFLWLEDVGIPDYEDKSLMLAGGISNFSGGWCAEFASIVPDGEEPAVRRRHNFQVVGNVVYDFWLDTKQLDSDARIALEDAVKFREQEESPAVREPHTVLTFLVEGMEETSPATLQAGQGYSLYLPDGQWALKTAVINERSMDIWENINNTQVQFQIVNLGRMDLSQGQNWVKSAKSGFQLLEDKQGGLGGTSVSGNILMDVTFHPANDVMFAVIRQYPVEAAEGFGARLQVIADTFMPAANAGAPAVTPEEAAFAKCRAVMDMVQSGTYQILQQRTDGSSAGPDGYSRQYYAHNGDFLTITERVSSGTKDTQAELYANDRYFTNGGNEASEDLIWKAGSDFESAGPWLDRFLFVKKYVTFIDDLADGEGECCMFRVDALYEDAQGYSPNYFVNFYFTPDGAFQRVELQVNLFQDNAFTETETIVTLDPQTIEAAIAAEYRRAVESGI